MRLLLIRHGQTPSNVLGLLDTAVPGPGLTDLGLEQAAAIPGALAAQRIDALYASNQTRAALTAQPLAASRGLGLTVRDGLREISAGELEMRGDDEAVKIFVQVLFGWLQGDLTRAIPGGENAVEVLDRFDAVVAEAATVTGPDGIAAMVSHGAAIRVWAGTRAVNLDGAFGTTHGLGNTGMVVLQGDPASGWEAVSWAGTAIGGSALDDPVDDGPVAEAAVPDRRGVWPR